MDGGPISTRKLKAVATVAEDDKNNTDTPPNTKYQPLSRKKLDILLKQYTKPTIAARDNVTVNNPVVPVNDTPQAISTAQHAAAVNHLAQQKDAYYNPEVIKGITSGDKSVDFLYNNQYLMDLPIVGGIIKDKAYDMAKNSGGLETLDPKQLADIKNGKRVTYGEGKYKQQVSENYKGGDLLNEKKNPINLLDQYFGKMDLPDSKYKPTSDYLPFLPTKSIKGDFEKTPGLKTYDFNGNLKELKTKDLTTWINYIKNANASFNGIDPNTLDYNKKPIFSQEGYDSPISNALGVNLNGHKLNVAFDKEKNLPYISISDAWDFKPDDYAMKSGYSRYSGKQGDEVGDRAYIESSLMHKAGKPFKVYDRFYFDPKTKQYIPDDKLPQSKK